MAKKKITYNDVLYFTAFFNVHKSKSTDIDTAVKIAIKNILDKDIKLNDNLFNLYNKNSISIDDTKHKIKQVQSLISNTEQKLKQAKSLINDVNQDQQIKNIQKALSDAKLNLEQALTLINHATQNQQNSYDNLLGNFNTIESLNTPLEEDQVILFKACISELLKADWDKQK